MSYEQSWTLGKIFSAADEEAKNTVGEVSDSDDDEDEDVLAGQAAFNKNKQHSASESNRNTNQGSVHSIRRYDEYGDFISRSERARAEKSERAKKEAVPRTSSKPEPGHKHVVKFPSDENKLTTVTEIPQLTPEDKEACYMTTDNWQSIDTDIDITLKRWKNHKEGLIKFDEDNNTIRGIEDIIFSLNKNRPIYNHRKTVLEEIVRQKTHDEYLNWEKLSGIAEKSSAPLMKQARELGKEDQQERERVWSDNPSDGTRSFEPASPSKKQDPKKSKRKSSFFGLFKKK